MEINKYFVLFASQNCYKLLKSNSSVDLYRLDNIIDRNLDLPVMYDVSNMNREVCLGLCDI